LSESKPFAASLPPPRTSRVNVELWNAALFALGTDERRYFSRNTGEVRMQSAQAPNDTGDWVEIDVISQSDQMAAARAFLAEHDLAKDPVFDSLLR